MHQSVLLVCLSGLVWAQADAPPELQPAFHDDFGSDSQGQYRTTGDVSWEPGRLKLGQGASVEREIAGGSRTRIDLRLEPKNSDGDRLLREIQVWFRIDGATDCYVRLREISEGPGTRVAVTLVDTSVVDGKLVTQPVRELVMPATLHEVSLEYTFGLVRVSLDQQKSFAGYIDNGPATVRSLMLVSQTADCVATSLSAAATPARPFTADEQLQIEQAEARTRASMALYAQQRFAEAAEVGEQLAVEWEQAVGRHHYDYANCLDNLAAAYSRMGEYARAKELHQQALAIQETTLGTDHPRYAKTLNNLATVHVRVGDVLRAVPLYKLALRIKEEVQGTRDVSYGISMLNLATAHSELGQYREAIPLFERGLASLEALQHPLYAQGLTNFADVYGKTGDYTRAEAMTKKAIELLKQTPNRQIARATAHNNLAALYLEMDRFSEALAEFQRASDALLQVLGDRHPAYATSLNNISSVHRRVGDYARAEPLLQRALAIRKSVRGPGHPEYASSLHNLAGLYSVMGDQSRAKPLFTQALGVLENTLGERHPTTVATLHALGVAYDRMGQYSEAEPRLARASRNRRTILNESAPVQSARQQSQNQQSARHYLDSRLANSLKIDKPDVGAIATDLWEWKGAVTARQRVYRTVAADPKLAPLFDELQSVTRYLSVLSGQIPIPPPESAPIEAQEAFQRQREKWDERVDRLTRQREDLEQKIALESDSFRRIRSRLTTEQVQSWLPERSAFIDFVEYSHVDLDPQQTGKVKHERRYVAVIVPQDRPAQLVGLGSVQTISEAIRAFRRPFAGEPAGESGEPAAKLRRELWIPLERHLAGIETVVISPDTALGALPFGALPGKTGDGYLIEEYKFTSLPMASLLRPVLAGSASETRSHEGLLVVGDVDYDADPEVPSNAGEDSAHGAASARPAAPPRQVSDWRSLPGFETELQVVRSQFAAGYSEEKITTLRRSEATEARFITQAAKHSVLHLITHGYFADPTFPVVGGGTSSEAADNSAASLRRQLATSKAINQYLPGLLSGVVLAGANKPLSTDAAMADGILTASEIETLDLQNVDLVVLSACETGLGKTAGGEGMTGLRRAFHIAGARSVIASLWKVDDRATQELMRRFYTNLWIRKQSKTDALRNAQLWMLRNPKELESMGVRGATTRGKPRKVREDDPTKPLAGSRRTDPYFWAAFHLSGDWR